MNITSKGITTKVLLPASFIFIVLFSGCDKSDSTSNPHPTTQYATFFKIDDVVYRQSDPKVIIISTAGNKDLKVQVCEGSTYIATGAVASTSNNYKAVGWSIAAVPDPLPAGLSISFDPVQGSTSEDSSIMTIHTEPTVTNGSYSIRLQAQAPGISQSLLVLKIEVNLSPGPPPASVWKDVSPAGLPYLNGVAFRNQSSGFVVGDNGTIVSTADGGDTWHTVTSGTTKDLRAITFVDNDYGFIAGKDIFLRTTDGGNSWTEPKPGLIGDFRGMFALDSITVYIHETKLSSKLLTTTDKGFNWTFINNFNYVSKVLFTIATNGIMISGTSSTYSLLYTTTNPLGTWNTDAVRYEPAMFDMYNKGGGKLIACGYGATIYTSDNSGSSWTGSLVTGAADNFYALSFAGDHGIAVGFGGAIGRTTGTSWTAESGELIYDLWGVAVLNDNNAVAVGNGRRSGSSVVEGVIIKRK